MESTGTPFSLNDVDSLLYFINNLWSSSKHPHESSNQHIKIPILDNVLFRQGCPIRWIFTSEKTGEVLKKRGSRPIYPSYIIETFKKKCRVVSHSSLPTSKSSTTATDTLSKQKSHQKHIPIAILWFLRQDGSLACEFADEIELEVILRAQPIELLIAQVNILEIHHSSTTTRPYRIYEHTLTIPSALSTSNSGSKAMTDDGSLGIHETYSITSKRSMDSTDFSTAKGIHQYSNSYRSSNVIASVLTSPSSLSSHNDVIRKSLAQNSSEHLVLSSLSDDLYQQFTNRLRNSMVDTTSHRYSRPRIQQIKLIVALTSSWKPILIAAQNLIFEEILSPATTNLSQSQIKGYAGRNSPTKSQFAEAFIRSKYCHIDNFVPSIPKTEILLNLLSGRPPLSHHIPRETEELEARLQLGLHYDKPSIRDRPRPTSAPQPSTILRRRLVAALSSYRTPGASIGRKEEINISPSKKSMCMGDYCHIGLCPKATKNNLYHKMIEIAMIQRDINIHINSTEENIFHIDNKDYMLEPVEATVIGIPYKAILITREEVSSLEQDLDYDTDGMWKTRIQQVDQIDTVLRYYVDRHVKNIIRYCLVKGSKESTDHREYAWGAGSVRDRTIFPIKINNTKGNKTATITTTYHPMDSLSEVYRKKIITKAIGSVHPSKLSQPATLCQTCHQIYSYLSESRQKLMLSASVKTNHAISYPIDSNKPLNPYSISDIISPMSTETTFIGPGAYHNNMENDVNNTMDPHNMPNYSKGTFSSEVNTYGYIYGNKTDTILPIHRHNSIDYRNNYPIHPNTKPKLMIGRNTSTVTQNRMDVTIQNAFSSEFGNEYSNAPVFPIPNTIPVAYNKSKFVSNTLSMTYNNDMSNNNDTNNNDNYYDRNTNNYENRPIHEEIEREENTMGSHSNNSDEASSVTYNDYTPFSQQTSNNIFSSNHTDNGGISSVEEISDHDNHLVPDDDNDGDDDDDDDDDEREEENDDEQENNDNEEEDTESKSPSKAPSSDTYTLSFYSKS